MIQNYFYPVLTSDHLRRKPVSVTRFGRRWVLWRDGDGAAHAANAACPHRGADLAQGRVIDGHLTCPWHGFQFDADGACRLAPCEGERGKLPDNLRLNPATVRESHGLIWMWHGNDEPTGHVPFFKGLEERNSAQASYQLPYHYSRMVETNLDIFHTPFVHGNVLPGVGPVVRDFHSTRDGDQIQSRGQLCHADKDTGLPFATHFLAPCLVQVSLTPKLHIVIAATPIDDAQSWLWFRYYQSYTNLPLLRRWVSWFAVQSELRVVQKQDWRIFAGMTSGTLEDAPHNLVRADLAIAQYRQWRRERLALG